MERRIKDWNLGTAFALPSAFRRSKRGYGAVFEPVWGSRSVSNKNRKKTDRRMEMSHERVCTNERILLILSANPVVFLGRGEI